MEQWGPSRGLAEAKILLHWAQDVASATEMDRCPGAQLICLGAFEAVHERVAGDGYVRRGWVFPVIEVVLGWGSELAAAKKAEEGEGVGSHKHETIMPGCI